jgi:spore coat polysaccharide biosynthesis protein SpsF
MRAVTVITARLGSSRLPGKMLRPLRGRPVLAHVAERAALAKRPERIIVATTNEALDDDLTTLAEQLGVGIYRGPTEDVILRWRETADAFDADLLVTWDGDDVLVDPTYVDRIVECFEATGAGYITCTGLPFGAAPSGVSRDALVRVCALKTDSNTEGQGRFFADPTVVQAGVVEAPPELRHEEARLTLDYPEDLEFFERLVEALEPEGSRASMARIVEVLRARPDLVAINAGRQAEYWERFNTMYPAVELRKA